MSFSIATFQRLLSSIHAAGYRFHHFAQPASSQNLAGQLAFYLRFDVDVSPHMARVLGTIAADNNVRSSFFFQMNADTYNFFSDDTLRIMEGLRAQGHCVGLHIDVNIGSAEDAIAATLDWVHHYVVAVDRAISFHRPGSEVLGRHYASFVSAYDARYFFPDGYLSDSRNNFAFHDVLLDWLAERRPFIQLLLHPVWWSGKSSPAEYWQAVARRRERELAAYMLSNFSKVFSGHIPQLSDQHDI
jgi:hypothetical protein